MDYQRLASCQGYSDLVCLLKALFLYPAPLRRELTRAILRAHIANACGGGRFLPRLRQLLRQEGLSEDVCQLRLLQEYTRLQSRQVLRRVYAQGVLW